MANCIPSISFLPPEAESPEAGSNTPILTTLSPSEAPEPVGAEPEAEPEPEPEQPARADRSSAAESADARNFFMFILLSICLSWFGEKVSALDGHLFA